MISWRSLLCRLHIAFSIHREGLASFPGDRKSTRLNSSHSQISYAVFCLKKKHIHTERIGSAPHVRLFALGERRCEDIVSHMLGIEAEASVAPARVESSGRSASQKPSQP